MKAIVLRSRGYLEILDLPEPEVSPGEVKVRVDIATICGSDIEFFKGTRHPQWSFNDILGHEGAGEVVELGEGVNDLKVGDKVAIHEWANGCFTQYLATTPEHLYKYKSITEKEATVVEIAGACYGMLHSIKVKKGETAVVLGQGSAGLIFTAMLKVMGCSKIIASELRYHKLELAKKMGATHLINPWKQSVIEEVKKLTDGDGANIVIEAAGVPETILLV